MPHIGLGFYTCSDAKRAAHIRIIPGHGTCSRTSAAKAELVRVIGSTIEAVGLSQTMAAKVMGIDQPTLSKLLRGRVGNFPIDRLREMLMGLGR